MKYWHKKDNSIALKSSDDFYDERIIKIEVEKDYICFIEQCDDFFYSNLSKQEAIKALEEAICFIKGIE